MTERSSLRIVGAVLLVLAMSATCIMLGFWQWGRHHQKADAAARVEAAWDAPILTLDDVLAGGLTVTEEWQRVELSGAFVPGTESALRGRHMGGSPSSTALGLFVADSPELSIVVALGWQEADGVAPALPEGPQDLVARLRTEERSRGGATVSASVTEMNTSDVLRSMGDAVPDDLPTLQGYVQLVEAEQPLRSFTKPDSDLGNNLSYAFQWWFFAAAVPVGAVLLARRDRQEAEGVVFRPRQGRAEEEEDAIIDAQLGSSR